MKLKRGNPVPIINNKKILIKRDRVTNSQARHEETRSRATTGSPMTRKPSQTEDLTTCTGRPVFAIKSWDAGSGLETKEECDILSNRTIVSDTEQDEEEQLIDEFEENQESWKSFLET